MPVTTITCPNCGTPFQANIEQLIDVSLDPSAKARLLSGRLNVVRCPNCGYTSALSTPLAYHDAEKQLLIVHVPMELGLPKEEMERVIGSFTSAIQQSLPQEQRKGYLFIPKQAFTRQGMIDTILEADGITKEMIDAQRDKMKLVEQFLTTPPDQIADLVKANDAQLDAEFFTLMLAAAESGLAAGREDVAQAVVAIREQLLALSTFGQTALAGQERQQTIIQEVADRLNAMGPKGTRDTLADLVLALGREDDEKLQVAVGLARQAMDTQFFQVLSNRLMKSKDVAERQHIEQVRKRLSELTAIIDQQNETVIKRATDTLRGLLSTPDVEAAIEQRLELFDDTFLAVLQANIQAAEQARDVAASARLKQLFEKIVAALQSTAPPAVQFINELVSAPTFEDSLAMVQEGAAQFGPELLQWIDVLLEDLSASGEGNPALERLARVRVEVERALATAGPQALPETAGAKPLTDAPPPFTPRLVTREEPEPPPTPPGGKPIIELPSFRRGPRRER